VCIAEIVENLKLDYIQKVFNAQVLVYKCWLECEFKQIKFRTYETKSFVDIFDIYCEKNVCEIYMEGYDC